MMPTAHKPILDKPTWVLASHNADKVRELSVLLAPYGMALRTAAELNLAEPEETGSTFAENAALKARLAAEASGYTAIADDSGLVVPALDGAPGIYTARWAKECGSFEAAMQQLNKLLTQKARTDVYRAEVVSALAVARVNSDATGGLDVRVFEGRVMGTLIWPPRGEGPGFEPMFVQDGTALTHAEMRLEDKAASNQRAQAFAKLVTACVA